METEEERRARLENDASNTAQVGRGDGRKKKSKTGGDCSNRTAQVGPGDRGRKKSKKRMDLFWIEFGLRLKFSKTKIIQG